MTTRIPEVALPQIWIDGNPSGKDINNLTGRDLVLVDFNGDAPVDCKWMPRIGFFRGTIEDEQCRGQTLILLEASGDKTWPGGLYTRRYVLEWVDHLELLASGSAACYLFNHIGELTIKLKNLKERMEKINEFSR